MHTISNCYKVVTGVVVDLGDSLDAIRATTAVEDTAEMVLGGNSTTEDVMAVKMTATGTDTYRDG